MAVLLVLLGDVGTLYVRIGAGREYSSQLGPKRFFVPSSRFHSPSDAAAVGADHHGRSPRHVGKRADDLEGCAAGSDEERKQP